MRLKIYTDTTHYPEKFTADLNLITRSLWQNGTSEEKRTYFGDWVDLFQYDPDILQADICLLPYLWNHYVETETITTAQAAAIAAHVQDKPLVIFNDGDYPVKVPFEGAILFEASGYRSRPGCRYHSALPPEIDDYLGLYCAGAFKPRPKREVPVVGFCGQTNTTWHQSIYRQLRLMRQKWRYQHGRLKWEPPPFEPNAFRQKVLHAFEDQPGIETNYLLREKFWAGQVSGRSLHNPARMAYVENMLCSDYTLCMRGAGNYSYRFYETLCLGRIPIFIDTDCLLPFQDQIEYRAIFPWIDVKDLAHAAEIVRDFHAGLSEGEFLALQKVCRFLWQDHMTPEGFYKDFVKKMRSILHTEKT